MDRGVVIVGYDHAWPKPIIDLDAVVRPSSRRQESRPTTSTSAGRKALEAAAAV